jgi:hypothetical protein
VIAALHSVNYHEKRPSVVPEYLQYLASLDVGLNEQRND